MQPISQRPDSQINSQHSYGDAIPDPDMMTQYDAILDPVMDCRISPHWRPPAYELFPHLQSEQERERRDHQHSKLKRPPLWEGPNYIFCKRYKDAMPSLLTPYSPSNEHMHKLHLIWHFGTKLLLKYHNIYIQWFVYTSVWIFNHAKTIIQTVHFTSYRSLLYLFIDVMILFVV